ncbi:hypothetical protein [Actinophytocola xanthii]|uniref:Secreted protein n=1 Tax=Actinophytocola xanthii TaxID=1912961 RepID=A0A1Q8CDT2_9PSEU|nr:hypothetical protein [Actinophytocola xanthii]OLF12527.1 hypothetical protein BU204_28900 [Actinophytocola xanthii]
MRSITSRAPALALAIAAAGATTALAPTAAQADTAAQEPLAQLRIAGPDGEVTVQGTCGDSFTPEIVDGWGFVTARAYWSVWCSNGNVYMEGWVDDARSDGACAAVRGEFPNNPTQVAHNCPADSPRTEFTFKGTGRIVNGYLFLD